jgi:trimethylamine:corrinoid methyltransferase-like protein
LAEKLGRTVEELETQMSASEFFEWSAFYDWRAKEEKKAMDRAKNKRGR